MLAVPYAGKEVVVPQANAKVKDGVLEDETIIAFATTELKAFIASL